MTDKEKIENCYRQLYLGMTRKNRNVLSEVLDDSFVLIHITGMRQAKDAFIQSVEDGTLNYYSADHQRMDVSFNGGQAELLGQSVVNAAVFGGGRHTWRLQLKLKLIQEADSWKITEAKASTY
ncbi:MAG: nuclear transport factor 2 family protein [Acetatifactor sp.]|nr:nuclear transport factor 2 family protein [Acetatifactor sp.]